MYLYMCKYIETYHRPVTGVSPSKAVKKDTNRRASASKVDIKEVRAVSTDQKIRPTTGSPNKGARTKDTNRSVSTSQKAKKELRSVSTDSKDINKSNNTNKDKNDKIPVKNKLIADKQESDEKLLFPPVVRSPVRK